MAPSPQEGTRIFNAAPQEKTTNTLLGDEVVISGIAGVFPKSENVFEFMQNLYGGVDMISPIDLDMIHPEMPRFEGKISGLDKFDAKFFKVTRMQTESMEPTCRKVMEQTYGALFDAGINPVEFKGKKIGVYTSAMYCDSSKLTSCEALKRNGFVLSGSCKNMFANRISYWLDAKAPSYTVDCSCSGTYICVEQAFHDIKSGISDAVVVGGCQNCNHPIYTINMRNAGLLSLDGKTRCFDKNGDGYTRAEVVSAILLQKAKDAKRIYAQVYGAEAEYGLKPDAQFLPMRKSGEIREFLEKFYIKNGVSPSEVEYIEAHGAAFPEADANELEGIAEVFAKDKPVMVGCHKSNMGHTEPGSGICAIVKLCLAYHQGMLPGNLHYETPLETPALQNGKVKVVTKTTPFNRGFTAVNNFSTFGNNCHILLKGHYKPKDTERYKCNIPRLVVISGRYDGSVGHILDILKSHPIDPEQLGLLHNVYQVETSDFTCRGYTILDTNEKKDTISLSQGVGLFQGATPPLWLVYSGMGSQWSGMGAELMRIPIFAAAIEKCHKVLEPQGVDIINIICSPDKKMFDNILNCFVGIAAVQIGLTDVLKALGVVPDHIIGHSVGELGCAYFDGCFTTEEMILAAYARGLVSVQTELIRGAMAAVGLGYNEVFPMCPPEIDVACHNSSESCTISGPVDVMNTFVAELTAKGIFAKVVPCGNIAYHSRYIQKAGPEFLRKLGEVIKKPIQRSDKWISTSLPEDKWNDPLAKYSSPEYHANNLLSPVYFEETARKIPKDAVVLEVAPHGLLQAILKRSHPECVHLSLTRRGHSNPLHYLLDNLGKFYQQGYSLKLDVLYPKIEFPVSTETPMMSHFLKWYHEEDWLLPTPGVQEQVISSTRRVNFSILDDDYGFLKDHIREGNLVLPEAIAFYIVWETLAMYKGVDQEEMSIEFQDVHFHGEIIINPNDNTKVKCAINKGNSFKYFEVTRDDVLFANGYVQEIMKPKKIITELTVPNNDDNLQLEQEDIYKLMKLKGYSYQNEFKLIQSSSYSWDLARIKWTGNWVTFLDSLIQLNILARSHDGVSMPKIINSLSINLENMKVNLNTNDGISYYIAQRHDHLGTTECGGVIMKHVTFKDKTQKEQEPDILQILQYIPYEYTKPIKMNTAILINLQIVQDNILEDVITVTEVLADHGPNIKLMTKELSEHMPYVNLEIKEISTDAIANSNMLIGQNLFRNKKCIDEIFNVTRKDVFVLTIEDIKDNIQLTDKFNIISTMSVEGRTIALLNKVSFQEKEFILVTEKMKFSWLSALKNSLQQNKKVLLVSKKEQYHGLRGIVKKLRTEYKMNIGLVTFDDSENEAFIPDSQFYKSQLNKNLTFNFSKRFNTERYSHELEWGSYYYIPSLKTVNDQDFSLVLTESGDIESLKWVEMQNISEDDCITVCFAGPSAKDVENTVFPLDTKKEGFGMDFSGIDKKGNRVMGLVAAGALASKVKPDKDLLWPVPDHWSLKEAATVPQPYALALYCLGVKHEILPTKSVLVTGGAGALGQAVISICLYLGCTVYTSVGDSNKKRFLIKLFPELNEKHIGYSYDPCFYNFVLINSKNKKCDFVINCASNPVRELAMKCVASQGIFCDISTYDMNQDTNFGMYFLTEEKNYCAVNMSSIFRPGYAGEKKILHRMISDGIASGMIRPISYVTYTTENVPRAFRLLSQSKQRGRVLIRIGETGNSLTKGVEVIPRMKYSPQGTYVIVFDESDLSIELTDHVIKKGARNILINLKSKIMTQLLQAKIMSWRKSGVNLTVSKDDFLSEDICKKIVQNKKLINGIFIIKPRTNGNDFNQENLEITNRITKIVTNLDFATRKVCADLKNFVVIAPRSLNIVDEYSTSAIEQICEARTNSGLSALLLVPELLDEEHKEIQKSCTKLEPQSSRTALKAMEISLKHNYNRVWTYNLHNKSLDFLEKAAKIIGVTNINTLNEELFIKQIVFNEMKIEEIKKLIKDTYVLEYTPENIKYMTIASLKNLSNMIKKQNTKFDAGIAAFFNFVNKDEIMASEDFMPMPTISSLVEGDDNINPDETFLILVPGFEGQYQTLLPICERLKIPAMTLLLGPDISCKSIQEIAMGIKKRLIRRLKMKQFYILGYSFGINVALEIAALLEKDGLVGKVFCLDSSPDALRVQIDAYLGKISEEELQNNIIEHLFHIMGGHRNDTLKDDIQKLNGWPEKVDLCCQRLRKYVSCTTEYKKTILESAYRRILLAKNYNTDLKLKSELVLLKGIPHPKSKGLTSDYGLSKYSDKPVKVYELASDVASAPDDCRVANIVNQFLDPEVLKQFKKKNLCETYKLDKIGSGY